MNDILTLRKHTTLADMPKETDGRGESLLFADQQNDNFKISKSDITTSSFIRLGLKEAIIKNCSFTQSNFEDSYFRKAKFENVDFTGSSFHFCNFEKASFQSCNLRYCRFYHCILPVDEIKSCLPIEPNIKRDLARNLRTNFEMIGDKKAADTFLDIGIKANEEELKEIFLSKTEYYKTRNNSLDQLRAGWGYVTSKLSGKAWGYGHRIKNLILSYLIITFFLSLYTYFGGIQFFVMNQSVARKLTFWESMNMAFCETISASSPSFVPSSAGGQLLTMFASILGIIFFALLAATLYRKIAR